MNNIDTPSDNHEINVQSDLTSASPPMPKQIARAICHIMYEIPMLTKDSSNDYHGYKYPSIDLYLDTVRPLLAKAGLFYTVHLENKRVCVVKKIIKGHERDVYTSEFEFSALLHSSEGHTWDNKIRGTVEVDGRDAQAYGSAQSYFVKFFLRGLFNISAGEKDLDADAGNPNAEAGGFVPPKRVDKKVQTNFKRPKESSKAISTKDDKTPFVNENTGEIEGDRIDVNAPPPTPFVLTGVGERPTQSFVDIVEWGKSLKKVVKDIEGSDDIMKFFALNDNEIKRIYDWISSSPGLEKRAGLLKAIDEILMFRDKLLEKTGSDQ